MKQLSKYIFLAMSIASPIQASANEWQEPLNGIVNHVIKNGYNNYSASAQKLQNSSYAFCSTPSSQTLTQAKDSFKENTLDWQKIQWLNFGPVTYFMRYYAFEYWPDKKGITQRQLRALTQTDTEAMDAPKFWTSASIAVRGLTAIESLLYHPDFDPINSQKHCDLLKRVTKHHSESANEVSLQWKNASAQDWVFDEEGSGFDKEKAAMELFLQQWIEHMSAVKDAKLETPIGYHGRQNLKLAEFYRSDLSLNSIHENLKAYRKIYHSGSPSLFDIAIKSQPELAKKLEAQLIENQRLALQLPSDFFAPTQEQNEKVTMATPLVKSISLSQSYLTNLVTNLGFQIGFNSRDGD
ncbi:imelysin family protein [Marinomonas sp. C2222]|uniref:Imelysin family protein n=1 Tax=Marinomonas sargassi TaxID=2984494 RepID=A0ABT2YRW3_9GAMM|nr:imelysin family protein [Marinomonas sargassi]MCV2402622.1 imelysin family protein [Marinomonas sargassi]